MVTKKKRARSVETPLPPPYYVFLFSATKLKLGF